MDIRELAGLRDRQNVQDRPAFYAAGNKDLDITPTGSNITSRFLAGAGLVGAIGAVAAYRRIPNADVVVSRFLEKSFRGMGARGASTPLEYASKSEFYGGLPGNTSELINFAAQTRDYGRGAIRDVLDRFARTNAGLAEGETAVTVGDFLGSAAGSQNKLVQERVSALHSALGVLAGRSGYALSKLKQIPLGRNIVNVGGVQKDFRDYTIGGAIGRGLEWAHRNARIPFTSFAPTDVFLSTAWANRYNTAIIPAATRIKGRELGEAGIAFDDVLITASGRKIQGKYHIIRNRTALAHSIEALRGSRKSNSLEAILDKSDLEYLPKKFVQAQKYLRDLFLPPEVVARIDSLAAQGRYDQIETLTSQFKVPFSSPIISPQHRSESSVSRNVRIWLQKLAYGKAKLRPGVTERDLTALDRIGKVLKVQSSKYQYVREDLLGTEQVIGEGMTPMKQSIGKQYFAPHALYEDTAHAPPGVTPGMKIASTHTVIEHGEWNRTLANFFISRPSALLENLTGFSVAPADSVKKAAAYHMVLAPLALVGAWQAVQYFNFLTAGAPAKATAATAGVAEVGIGAVRDVTGITPAANMMETLFPGSVNSFASQLVRAVGLPVGGAYLGNKFLKDIDLPATAFSGLFREGKLTGGMAGTIGGVGLALATTLIDPTKSSVQLYKEATGEAKVPVKAGAGWAAGRTPFSGDRTLYYDYSLINKLWNYDAKDNLNYGGETGRWMHSWFPTPSNLFGIVPLLDPYHVEKRNQELRPYPTISAAGNSIPIVGPLVQGTIGEIIKPSIHNEIHTPSGAYGPPGGAEGLGFDSQLSSLDPRSGSALSSNLNRGISNLQDYSGIFGFFSRFPIRALTGSDTGIPGEMEYASSSQMTDPGLAFQEMNFAGGFGMTEYLRRIANPPPTNVNYYNPIPNSAPAWLPGTGSMFEGDQEYHIDFHKGDMYGKDKGPNLEYRLPGPGYATRGMHGESALDYVDIYSILSDVAPGSQAQSYYKRLMEQAITTGVADSSAISTYEQREKENIERLKGKYKFSDYPLNPTVSNTMGDQMKAYLGYVNVNIANSSVPGVNLLQEAWATVTHTQVPGLAWAQGKFMHNRTPLEEYAASNVTGTEFANWMDPYGAFIKPASYQVFDAITPGQFVPGEVEQRWGLEEYYDKLAYVKAKRLERMAKEQGQFDLANQFNTQSQQTIVGLPMDPRGFNTNIFKASPQYMRPFVAPFALATESEAQKIQEVLPSYMRNTYQQVWNTNLNRGQDIPQTNADQEVAEYFATHALPTKDSAIWNPNVDLNEYKLKTFESHGQEYFTQGIPESKAREFRALGRTDILLDGSTFGYDMDQRNALYEELRTDPTANNYAVSNSNIVRTNRISYSNPRKKSEFARDRSEARF